MPAPGEEEAIDLDEFERIAENWGPGGYSIESASVEDKADAEIALRGLARLVTIARTSRTLVEAQNPASMSRALAALRADLACLKASES